MLKIPDEIFCRLISRTNSENLTNNSLQIPKTFTQKELCETLISLLEIEGVESKKKYKFYVHDKLIQSTLAAHISKHSIDCEKVLEIYYSQSLGTPKVGNRIEFQDWVGNIHLLKSAANKIGVISLFSGNLCLVDSDLNQIGSIPKSTL